MLIKNILYFSVFCNFAMVFNFSKKHFRYFLHCLCIIYTVVNTFKYFIGYAKKTAFIHFLPVLKAFCYAKNVYTHKK